MVQIDVLAFDPGPLKCGVARYADGQLVGSWNDLPVGEAVRMALDTDVKVVAIERVQSTGQSGASLLRTSEVVGKLELAANLNEHEPDVELLYRREVCSALHVHGAGKDRQVRQAMIEAHGGSKEEAVGRKATPGPLYGVAGHAWQALGLAYTVYHRILEYAP